MRHAPVDKRPRTDAGLIRYSNSLSVTGQEGLFKLCNIPLCRIHQVSQNGHRERYKSRICNYIGATDIQPYKCGCYSIASAAHSSALLSSLRDAMRSEQRLSLSPHNHFSSRELHRYGPKLPAARRAWQTTICRERASGRARNSKNLQAIVVGRSIQGFCNCHWPEYPLDIGSSASKPTKGVPAEIFSTSFSISVTARKDLSMIN